VKFEIISEISNIEIIAVGSSIRDLRELQNRYGGRRWRKLKGFATVRQEDGSIREAEIHWYECHGVGRRRLKVKRWIEP
jgi:hypothetical protein